VFKKDTLVAQKSAMH